MRILLFLATNMAVLVLVSIIFNLLGLEGILAQNGVDLNLGPLLIFCVLFGFGGFLASTILFWFSRWWEYRADHAGATLTTPTHMIAALQRLQMEQNQPQDLPGELTAFGISEQLKQGISGLFRSHPPLDDRIRALQGA
jgi:Zn-dependent protease with chaperone function